MASNKYLIEDKNKLLKKRLELLSKTLDQSVNSGTFQTQEQLLAESVNILQIFYRSLNKPSFNPQPLHGDDLPSLELYNSIWNTILDDLVTLFTELENIELLTLANFNFVATESNRLTTRLKSISSQLGDYILYSSNPTKDAFFFTDSFNDLTKIDVGSSLLNKTQCDINQEEGIITLPINKDKNSSVKIKALPIINPDSNGVIGNNKQLNATFNGNIDLVLDNNPDTWFEYEKVVEKDDSSNEALILDMTINLGQETVINSVRINPNNFGTKTVIVIEKIETSLDGKSYINIKDDIPIGDFLTEDEANIFTLAPSTSKFAGQGLYTFQPRKAKYLHLVFKQSEPYVISTSEGDKLRYAIGIRDIDIRGYIYNSEGEVISKSFSTGDEIRKILLQTNQNPTDFSELASIDYSVSPDDGQTWYPIQPKQFTGTSGNKSIIPEILNFNGPEIDSVSTTVPVQSVRLKASITRNDDVFANGSSTLRKEILPVSELHSVPTSSPFQFTLENSPVDGTLEVIDPLFGSRGIPAAPYIVGHASQNSPRSQRFHLPFLDIPRPIKKVSSGSPTIYYTKPVSASEWFHVMVGGEEWTHGNKPITAYTSGGSINPEFRIYTLDHKTGELVFGNDYYSMQPPIGSPITVWLEPEHLFPAETPGNHIATLDFKTGSDKNAFTIKRYGSIDSFTEILSKKETILQLSQTNIVDISNLISTMLSIGMDNAPVTFLNGRDELITSTNWSIDSEHGIIYLGTPTPSDRDISVTYTYQVITILNSSEWDWGNLNSLRDSVVIKDNSWITNTQDSLSLPTTVGIRVLDLAHLYIVKGTIQLTLLDNENPVTNILNPFVKEVPFVDGTSELGGLVIKTTEKLGLVTPNVNQIATHNLKENISSNTTDHIVTFSRSNIFITEKSSVGLVTSIGDYFIDRTPGSLTYGKLTVKVSSIDPIHLGKITYFYTNPKYANNGLFSVDYKSGKLYTQRSMQGGLWSLTATYQYTDYRAEYKIARLLDPNQYVVDPTNKAVTIKDEEVLKYSLLPKEVLPNQKIYYQVNYDSVSETREQIDELKDYFTPILKDYMLKVITRSNLL